MSDVGNRVSFNLPKDEETEVFLPPAPLLAGAHISGLPSYHDHYRSSINDPSAFWSTVAADLFFHSPSSDGLQFNFDVRRGRPFTRFMHGARTNMAYNCLERNLQRGMGEKVAFFWEGNDPADSYSITYSQLHAEVVKAAAMLRERGVRKGDTVVVYLPMILEMAVSMLACARIGAIHSVVFAGFSAESLAARIVDAKTRIVLTADGSFRGHKLVCLKPIVDDAVDLAAGEGVQVEKVLVVEHLPRIHVPAGSPPLKCGPSVSHSRDELWSTAVASAKGDEAVEWTEAEDPLFILYTSGSTGKPKGIVHSTAGYMTYTYQTTKLTFDTHAEKDVYWCTADCGWITGHSYLLYGPLLNGLSSVFFEGVPTFPDASRMWQVVEKYRVNKLYTSPTAVRALMALGNEWVSAHDRSSLEIIGTVGEPINPSAWRWLHSVVGEDKAVVIDTYWQTETGGHVIAPLPGATPLKPGSATFACLGVEAILVDSEGRVIEGPGEGNLCFARGWPGMLRGVWGDEDRFSKTYFSSFPGFYFTGDGARRDEDGYIWVTGRVDDLMNVSGHLLSTAEIESALASHAKVAEAAVVAAPHDIKGSFPYAFVNLVQGERLTPSLVAELKQLTRQKIGPIAVPDIIQQAPGLPKTRSGKVTRRILRKIAEGFDSGLGDTTTLVDESVIGQLISGRPNSLKG